MIHKERVLKALSKEQPDRVPFFFWAAPEFSDKMMAHLGFTDRDQLLEYLGVDFRFVEPTYIGKSLISADKKTKKDIWGVGYSKMKEGDNEYWNADMFPLQGVTDPAELDSYPWPTVDLFDFESLLAQTEKYKDYAIMTAPGYSSPGLFRIIQRLLGREDFLDVMMSHPKFFEALCIKVTSFYMEFVEKMMAVAGDKIDFIRIADNFGSDYGLSISHEIWESYCKPAIEAFIAIPRQLDIKIYMHSSGGVRKLLPEFISIGVDLLGPITPKAKGMNPADLEADFGKYMSFCGALDEELLLRNGTVEEVKAGVTYLLETMSAGGGFILGPSHKFKVETPVENVIAMYEAAKAFKY